MDRLAITAKVNLCHKCPEWYGYHIGLPQRINVDWECLLCNHKWPYIIATQLDDWIKEEEMPVPKDCPFALEYILLEEQNGTKVV